MIISLAAAAADFSQFEWFSATEHFSLKLTADPALRVEEDDLVGLRKATRGPTAGAYQVVLAKYPQLIFRSVPEKKVNDFRDKLKPFQGVPATPEKKGQRHSQLRKQHIEQGDKQTSQFYKPPKNPVESGSYDKSDYQWRIIVHPTRVSTKKEMLRQSLHLHDVVGMRYVRKSHGGFIILPSGERVMISHETYEEITNNSDILPRAKQERGIVDLKDIIANLPKGTRIRIPRAGAPAPKPRKPKTDAEPGPSNGIDLHKELVSKHHYKDLDDDFEFEPEDEEDVLNPPDEMDDFEPEDDEETVKTGKKPAAEDMDDFEEEEPEDDPEMDFQMDEPVDEETGEPIEDEEAIYAHEGLILATKTGEEWIILGIEESGMADILFMYNEKTNATRHYKFPAGEDLRNSKSVTVKGEVTGNKLEKLKEKAADVDVTAGKRLS